MDGTLTYIGDYDQCLDIEIYGGKGNSTGKYCAVNLMPKDYTRFELSPDILHLQELPLAETGFYFGLCFPANCSKAEIGQIVSESLKSGHYPLELETMSCDTKESISYSTRFSNLTMAQKISLGFVLIISTIVLIGSLIRKSFPGSTSTFVTIFAVQDNFTKAFFVDSVKGQRSQLVDLFKLFILLFAIAGHASFCLDTPFSVYIIGHYRWLLGQVITN